jgi:hypothetical protein
MLIRGLKPEVIAGKIRKLGLGHGQAAADRKFIFFADGLSRAFDGDTLAGRVGLEAYSRLYRALGRAFDILPFPREIIDIRVKNSIRLNHRSPTGEIRSVKIALALPLRPGNLAREIAARHILKRNDAKVPVPRLLRYDQSHLQWLEEEYIDQGEAPKSARIRDFLKFHADGFYRVSARPRPLAQTLRQWNVTPTEIEGVLREAGHREPTDFGGTWPIALIHGDLNAGNMMADRENRLYLVDLERFGRGPMCCDLRKLYLSEPDLVLDVLRANTSASDMKPELQMKVALSVMLLSERRREKSPHQRRGRHGAKKGRDLELERSGREKLLLSMIASGGKVSSVERG